MQPRCRRMCRTAKIADGVANAPEQPPASDLRLATYRCPHLDLDVSIGPRIRKQTNP